MLIKKGEHRSPNTEFKKGHVPQNPFKKGQIPWNKNKSHSEETRRKMSESHKGKKHSEEHKRKIRESCKKTCKNPKMRKLMSERAKKAWQEGKMNGFKKGDPKIMGENNPRYTGYTHKKYKIKQLEWLALRQLILERDNFKCQSCGRTHHEMRLDIHHKIPFRISGDNSPENLITLCRSCHVKTEYVLIKQMGVKTRW